MSFHGSIGAYHLTSLALCHSTLHTLTIPYIYSRFDIVWPDNASGPEPRAGVDALTYGLSTLVMAEEIFGNRRNQSMEQRIRRRRGNHFASFTKKFSLGNGPPEWVSDCKCSRHTHYISDTSISGSSHLLSPSRLVKFKLHCYKKYANDIFRRSYH
jgi:hypothetical protein